MCRPYGWVFGPKLSKDLNKGPFFGRFSINIGGLSRNWRKILAITRGHLSENQAADPRRSASHVPPPPPGWNSPKALTKYCSWPPGIWL